MFDLQQMLDDSEHVSKIIETFWLFWTFVLIGFDNGLLGPCLPDLQRSVGASLEQMSYVFFVQGIGALLGNVFGYMLERRFDRRLLIGLYVLTGSIVNIAIPLVPNYFYLLGLFLLQGLTKGLADFGAMSLCNVLWRKDKALPFQFIVVGAGISTFVSPFLAQPFIENTLTTLSPSGQTSVSLGTCQTPHSDHLNQPLLTSLDDEVQWTPLSSVTDVPPLAEINEAIKWPFIIIGCVTLPAAVAFIYLFFARPPCEEDHLLDMELSVSENSPVEPSYRLLGNEEKKFQPRRGAMVFRTLIVSLNVPVFGLLLMFADLLTSIGMASPLCMTPVQASYFNTVLWGAAMIGRVVSAFTLLCVPMFLQLLFCSIALVATGTVLAVSSGSSVLALWFGTAGVGLFATPSMPGFIAWSGDYVKITPFFMNLCLCAAGVGEMVLPFVGGQLVAAFGSRSLMLFALLVMIAMLTLFLMAFYIARGIKK